MDILSLIGILLGLVAVLGGSIAKGSGIGALWNAAAFIIVVLGTLGATLVQARLGVFTHGMKMLPWVFRPPAIDNAAMIRRVVDWSNIARKEGLLGLESVAEEERDPFARKGLQLLVDGTEPQVIRQILESDVDNREAFDLQGAKVFESMGVYAPTLGIVGAVMGLMAVMQNLTDPDRLGAGIAAAFVATVYGIASANLLFLPVANKLKALVQERSRHQEMLMEGLIAIAEGENPRNIESKLGGYVHG
ncbi:MULTISPECIES: flagellar motor protein [unclassified Thioalkalivibrio]|uniref:flagellar motor protein n=1 Tax=unclassified Thioalkalivibrio TaxID=2621013 RepID=UPI00037652EB|nr:MULTISPECIES: flagellar motor protein [unclassified Thioalkalivibrio]